MASRKIEDLSETMQDLYRQFERGMDEAGIDYVVTCTARSDEEQAALFAQGRKPLAEVNALRAVVGYPPIDPYENLRKVTWTLESKHIVKEPEDRARAFDIVILKPGRKAEWSIKADVNGNEIPDYEEAGKIGKSVGLKWGGEYGDYVHFEGP
jgi:peptidoglycan L-alanyl-D-glutamate endopeptidase CwlK